MMKTQKLGKLKSPQNRSSHNVVSDADHSVPYKIDPTTHSTKNMEKRKSKNVDFSDAVLEEGGKGKSENRLQE